MRAVLSPRLEAELINMITRPGQRDVSSPVERLQIATFYGLLGLFLGVMGLAGVLWLSQLLGKVQQQNESIQALTAIVEKTASNQRLVNDTVMERSKLEKSLDFPAQYERAVKERDEAVKQVGLEQTTSKSLMSTAKELDTRNSILAADLESAQTKLARYERDAIEAPRLREKNADLVESEKRLQEKLDKIAPWLDSADGKRAQALEQNLVRTRYAAYFGWGFSVLLGLALAASHLLAKPVPDASLDDTDRPTHVIE